ncbi:MAG: potE [Thermomicrobiales bacterium]|nr:potE [Thermomicrobiales bacterium]
MAGTQGGSLRRSLGLGSLTFYGVGLILGAGIYSILGEAAGIAGEALWQSFLLGSLAALLTGLSYAELATMFPRAGAEYVYLGEAWPGIPWLSGAIGWVLVMAGCATTATVALAFAGYASLFLALSPWVVAVALVSAAVALNVVGVQEASWVNIAFTLVEAGGLIAVIVAGARSPQFGEAFRDAPHPGVLGGAALIFFAYLGFEDIANLAEEAPHLAGAVGGVALFATANTALITVTAASRLAFALARGGDAPPVLGRTLAARQTPAAATVFAGGVALAFLPLGGVGFVGSVASLLALLAFAAVNAALVRLRFTRPEAARPFRVPLQIGRLPVLVVLGLMMVVLLFAQFEAPVYGLAVVALILALIVQAIPWRGRTTSGRSG